MPVIKIHTSYKALVLLIVTIAFSNTAFSQYTSHYTEKNRIKKDTLIDSSGTKFIIDKERIYITAIDKNGKLLWKTDPAKDNKLEKYRVDRPTLVYFALHHDKRAKAEVLWITYNNTQFGHLDKLTGKFTFHGQD